MEYKLMNDTLTVVTASKGAEIISIKKNNQEYLWQRDTKYWADSAPLLFPYVGRFTEGKYRYQGREYEMNIHGFARGKEFSVVKQDDKHLVLELTDDEETRKIYPFQFCLQVSYEIAENKIKITYKVENKSEDTMYFGIGGHPGFQVPLDQGLAFSDYYLEFSKEHHPERVGHTSDCFLSGENTQFALASDKRIGLSHGMFDEDAIVLQNVADQVTLKTDKGKRSITISYPDLPYLGLWHAPRTEAPYICIEPWTSLPSRHGMIEDIQFKHDLIRLHSKDSYRNEWCILIE